MRPGPWDTASERRLIAAWRICGSHLWYTDDLDVLGPATKVIPASGLGVFLDGVVPRSTDVGFAGPDDRVFTCAGSDEGTGVSGSGPAELGEDDVLEMEPAFHLGDDAVPKARRV